MSKTYSSKEYGSTKNGWMVAGELIGVRSFLISWGSVVSTIVGHYWSPIMVHTAQHLNVFGKKELCRTFFLGSVQPSPVIGCACGFYAAYSFNLLKGAEGAFVQKNIDPLIFNSVFGKPQHTYLGYGIVAASGRIILGNRGFRAQKMRILKLCVPKAVKQRPPGFEYVSFKEILKVKKQDAQGLLDALGD